MVIKTNTPTCAADTGDQCDEIQRNKRHSNYTGREPRDKEGSTH